MGNEPSSISTFWLNIYSAYLFIPHQTTSHCAVVTRVCCGSQDPTDCWPGKAGTGSRQQQLPSFPLYFPRPHSDCSGPGWGGT